MEIRRKRTSTTTGVALLAFVAAFQATMVTPVSAQIEHDHVLQKQTHAACQYDSDCIENAYCWSQQTCLCKEGFLVNRNRTHVQCLRIATQFGDPCTVDVQCRVTFAAQAQCRDGTCQCLEGSHFQDGRCYESRRIGEICPVSNNCYVEDSPSYCVTGICTCPFQHHPNEDGTRCIRSSFLEDDCSSDAECIAMHSRCLDVCRCRVDHVISEDRKRCLKAANTVGEACEQDSQCQAFMSDSKCIDGVCGCVTNYHQRGPICVKSVLLTQACTDPRECVTPTYRNSNSSEVASVDCISGICSCTSEYAMTENSLDCVRWGNSAGKLGTSLWKYFSALTLVQMYRLSNLK